WENGTLTQAVIYPAKDGILSLCYPGISRAEVRENNFSITFDILSDDRVSFAVRRGKAVTVSHIPKRHPLPPPVRNLSVDENRLLTFESDFPVRLYYANDSSPAYTLLADGITENAFRDDSPLPKYGTTYRAVSVDPAGKESLPVSVRFAVLTDFERAREKRMFLKHI
ncbi:MAG: hypothetical protein MJ078_06045, partial [Clostridia bacterium]|nr:hypothetical protein [Clostridia bacterium]